MAKEIMSERASTEEEFYGLALEYLKSLGVDNPQVGEPGEIPVRPGEFELLDVDVKQNTSKRQQLLNQLPRKPSERFVLGDRRVLGDSEYSGICAYAGCTLISLLPIECSYIDTTWIEPDLLSTATPSEVNEATAYMNPLNARIEGSGALAIGNKSKPGERQDQEIFKCQENGPVETETIEDSAVLDEVVDGEFIDDDRDNTLTSLTEEVEEHSPRVRVDGTFEFEESGSIETIRNIMQAWSTGTMTATIESTIDVEYEWRGDTNSETFDVDGRAIIPVSSLNYNW